MIMRFIVFRQLDNAIKGEHFAKLDAFIDSKLLKRRLEVFQRLLDLDSIAPSLIFRKDGTFIQPQFHELIFLLMLNESGPALSYWNAGSFLCTNADS
jgi:hypothetical protein